MPKIKKVLTVFIAVFALFFIASAVSVAMFGKKFAEEQLAKNLKEEVSLGGIGLSLPFNIRIADLKIGDLFSAERVSFIPNLAGLFSGRIVLSGVSLINPVVNFVQNSDGSNNLPALDKGGKQQQIILTGLSVKNGKFIYNDKKIAPQGFVTEVDQINIELSRAMLPLAGLKASFKMSALVLQPDGEVLGALKFNGWADFISKNMDAALTATDLNVGYFAPYYGNFISEKKLVSAKLNLESKLKSKDNALDINSNLVLSDLVYARQEAAEPQQVDLKELFSNTLDLFADERGNIKLNFVIKTDFDNPRITIAALKKAAFEAAAKNLISQRPSLLQEKVNTLIGQFKSLRKGAEAEQAQ